MFDSIVMGCLVEKEKNNSLMECFSWFCRYGWICGLLMAQFFESVDDDCQRWKEHWVHYSSNPPLSSPFAPYKTVRRKDGIRFDRIKYFACRVESRWRTDDLSFATKRKVIPNPNKKALLGIEPRLEESEPSVITNYTTGPFTVWGSTKLVYNLAQITFSH